MPGEKWGKKDRSREPSAPSSVQSFVRPFTIEELGRLARVFRLLSFKSRTKRPCRRLIPHLLLAIHQLRTSGFAPLLTLRETLSAWKDEIARMWRFTKNNGITEGFHTRMEMISRRAFGFRNFENYRLRVKILCG